MNNPTLNSEQPQLQTAYDFLCHYAETTPDSEALVFKQQRYSYSTLKLEVDNVAKALIHAGVKTGDRVACMSAPHPDCMQVLLATMSIGAIWVGINPRYQIEEMKHVINDAKPSLLFTRSQIGKRNYQSEIEQLQQCSKGLNTIIIGGDAVCKNSQSFEDFLATSDKVDTHLLKEQQQAVEGQTPCLIVYTSGTTGKPKGALLKQSACVRHGKLSLAQFKPTPLKVINYYPVNHVAGVVANSIYTLVGGGCNFLMEQFSPSEVLALIEAEKITQWGGIPTMLQLCVNHSDFETRNLSSVQLVNWGGSAAPEDLIQILSSRFPYLSTLYASTEITGGAFIVPPSKNTKLLGSSVGNALTDVEYRLIKPNGDQAELEEVGELEVRGDFLMLRYWNNPDATAETIDQQGWLKTGDLAKLDQQGNLYLIGRCKEMYKSGGFNIYPREVEQAIETLDGVEMVAVVSVSDPLYGEVGHAFISGSNHLQEQQLKEMCQQILANYKVPKAFHVLETLPLLPNGKVDKKRLQKSAQQLSNQATH